MLKYYVVLYWQYNKQFISSGAWQFHLLDTETCNCKLGSWFSAPPSLLHWPVLFFFTLFLLWYFLAGPLKTIKKILESIPQGIKNH